MNEPDGELEVAVFEQHATSPCSETLAQDNAELSWVGNCGCTCLCPST